MTARPKCAASPFRISSGSTQARFGREAAGAMIERALADIAAALVEYVQGTGKWDKVQSAFVDGWSTEWNNNEESLGSVPEAQKFDAKS